MSRKFAKRNFSGQSRREFLLKTGRVVSTVGAAAALAPFGAVNAFAQASDYKAMVCIFQFGGNDANNMVVPMGARYAEYAAGRPSIAIPQASLLSTPTAGGEAFGLHPSLAPIHAHYAAKRLAIVANVGMLVRPTTKAEYKANSVPVPMNLFSHSDQQMQWQNASPNAPSSTGWGGRVADRLQGLNAPSSFPPSVAINGNALQLIGLETKPTTVADGFGISGNDGSAAANARQASLQEMLQFDSGVVLFQAANTVLNDGIAVVKLIQDAASSAGPLTTAFPGSSLGQQLAQVAKIVQIRAALGMKRQIFFVTQGGYDTHDGQLPTHANLLADLAASMQAFYNATVEMGVTDQVVTFTESEFNRTFNPNGNVGTDHAWGGHCLALGGPVKGGDMYGQFPTLALTGPDDSGTRGNWIPTTSLDQYGATFAQWFGVHPIDLPLVFPNIVNFPVKTLPFMV
ncbi:MAG: DUF1501 domain-containing protein [Bryobacteraceae bacterium]|nr:DUF1501 domain-containing protein [Bryobacteraceae bacterium]